MMVGSGLPTTQKDECAFLPSRHELRFGIEVAIMHLTFYLEMGILLTYSESDHFSRFGKLREIAREVTVTRKFQSFHLLPSSHYSNYLISFHLL